jgi:hypothetical protein
MKVEGGGGGEKEESFLAGSQVSSVRRYDEYYENEDVSVVRNICVT